MSKIIEEGIKKILENDNSPEEKISEILDLKFSSPDIKNVEKAIIDIFDTEYNAELANIDIDSEVSNIAYRNEGILAIADERAVAGISKEREDLLVALKEKIEGLKESKKRVEEPTEEVEEANTEAAQEEEEEIVVEPEEKAEEKEEVESAEAEQEISKEVEEKVEDAAEEVAEQTTELPTPSEDILKPIFTDDEDDYFASLRARKVDDITAAFEKSQAEERPSYTPIGTRNIYDSDNPTEFFKPYRRVNKNYGIYTEPERSTEPESHSSDDFIDRQIAELNKEAAALSVQVNNVKAKNFKLTQLKNEKIKLFGQRDAELRRLEEEIAHRKRGIMDKYEKKLQELYSRADDDNLYSSSEELFSNPDNSSLDFRLL